MQQLSSDHRRALLVAVDTNTLVFPRWYGRWILWFLSKVRFVTPFTFDEAGVFIAGYIYEEDGRYEVNVSRCRLPVDRDAGDVR